MWQLVNPSQKWRPRSQSPVQNVQKVRLLSLRCPRQSLETDEKLNTVKCGGGLTRYGDLYPLAHNKDDEYAKRRGPAGRKGRKCT